MVLTRFSVPALLIASLVSPAIAASEGTTFEFSTCGASGRTGPSQTQCNNAYQGTNLEDQVEVVGEGIQEWTVPEDGTYRITAAGAQGGSYNIPEYNNGGAGGKGAVSEVEIELKEGSDLSILVGQRGETIDSGDQYQGAGGGGGAFVVASSDFSRSDISDIIAVGGGGSGAGGGSGPNPGQPAVYSRTAPGGIERSADRAFDCASGGSNGNAGKKSTVNRQQSIPGAGFLESTSTAKSFVDGGTGGENGASFPSGFGGFGGGSGGGERKGGAGGGFSGGGSCSSESSAGDFGTLGSGSSYVKPGAVNLSATSRLNSGPGYVKVKLVQGSGPGFCDFRGPRNQCISNQTNFLSQSSFDVSSALLVEPSAVFQSSLPQPFINVSNSTRLSGEWRGGFEVSSSSSPVIGAGASFEPGEEDIVIGK